VGGKSQWEKSNLGQLMRQGCYFSYTLDIPQVHQYFSFRGKRAFIFPISCYARYSGNASMSWHLVPYRRKELWQRAERHAGN
jgi:hypothetical protein